MTTKVASLVIRLIEQVSGPVKAAASALAGVGKAADAIGKTSAAGIGNLTSTLKQVDHAAKSIGNGCILALRLPLKPAAALPRKWPEARRRASTPLPSSRRRSPRRRPRRPAARRSRPSSAARCWTDISTSTAGRLEMQGGPSFLPSTYLI